MPIDRYRLAIAKTAFQNLSARSQGIIFAVHTSSKEAAAEELHVSGRTVDQHYQRFLLGAGLDEAEGPIYLHALLDSLMISD